MRLLVSAAAFLSAFALLPAAPAGGGARNPFDFELAPRGTAKASAASGGWVVSRPLRTPHRFQLLGMRWRGRAEPRIVVRVRRPRRGWSRWQAIAAHADHNPDARGGERTSSASDPLWVGDANAVQYRISRRVPGLRLHFVNVGSGARARAAQEPQPGFVPREAWGADQCRPRGAPEYGAVKAVHVHHTVSLNDYSAAEAPSIVLAICRYHRNSNGWNDIGYNALVDKYGVLYEGRAGGLDQAVVGAQAQGYNAQTSGIANIGDHSAVEQTPQALAAIARFIRWKLGVHGQPLFGTVTLASTGGPTNRFAVGRRVTVPRVLGHRDTNSTACPGTALYGQLDELRRMVETGAPGVPAFATRLEATLGDTRVDFGETASVSGRLVAPDGTPLVGEVVEVKVNGDGRWRTARRTTTAPDGSFTTELRPRLRMYVRVRYPGRPQVAPTLSTRLLLRVRPLVRIASPRTRGVAGKRVPVRGRVAPRKRIVHLVLQQRIRARWRKVGVRAVPARRGRFRSSFVPAYTDLYRFYVVAKADLDTDRGASAGQVLRVRSR